jgi:hypothetical protein
MWGGRGSNPRPKAEPAFILVVWPTAATVTSPDQFPAVIANIYKVLAEFTTARHRPGR